MFSLQSSSSNIYDFYNDNFYNDNNNNNTGLEDVLPVTNDNDNNNKDTKDVDIYFVDYQKPEEPESKSKSTKDIPNVTDWDGDDDPSSSESTFLEVDAPSSFLLEPVPQKIMDFLVTSIDETAKTFENYFRNNAINTSTRDDVPIKISSILLFVQTMLDSESTPRFDQNYPVAQAQGQSNLSSSSSYSSLPSTNKAINPVVLVSALEECAQVYTLLDTLMGNMGDLREITHSQLLEAKSIKILPDHDNNKEKQQSSTAQIKKGKISGKKMAHIITLWYGLFLTNPPPPPSPLASTFNNASSSSKNKTIFDPWNYITQLSLFFDNRDNDPNSETMSNLHLFKSMKPVFRSLIDAAIEMFKETGTRKNDQDSLILYPNTTTTTTTTTMTVITTTSMTATTTTTTSTTTNTTKMPTNVTNVVHPVKSNATLVKDCFDILLFLDHYPTLCKLEDTKTRGLLHTRPTIDVLNQILGNAAIPQNENEYNPLSISVLTIQHDILSKICVILGSFKALITYCHQLCYSSLFNIVLNMGSVTLAKLLTTLYLSPSTSNITNFIVHRKESWTKDTRTKKVIPKRANVDINWLKVFSMLPDKKKKPKEKKKPPEKKKLTNSNDDEEEEYVVQGIKPLYAPFVLFMRCNTIVELDHFIKKTITKSLSTGKLFFMDKLDVYENGSRGDQEPESFPLDSLYSKYMFRKITTIAHTFLPNITPQNSIDRTAKMIMDELKILTKINDPLEIDRGQNDSRYRDKFGSFALYCSNKEDRKKWLDIAIKSFLLINYRKSTTRYQCNYFPLWIFYYSSHRRNRINNNDRHTLKELVIGNTNIVQIPDYFIDAELMGGSPTTLRCALDKLVITSQELKVFRTWHDNTLYEFFGITLNNPPPSYQDSNSSSSSISVDALELKGLSLQLRLDEIVNFSGFPNTIAPSRYNSSLFLSALPNLIDFDKRYFHTFVPLAVKLLRMFYNKKGGKHATNDMSIDSIKIDNISPKYNVFEAFESILCIEENAPLNVHLGRCWLSDSFFNDVPTTQTKTFAVLGSGFGFKTGRIVMKRSLTPRLNFPRPNVTEFTWASYSFSINNNGTTTSSLFYKTLKKNEIYDYNIIKGIKSPGILVPWESPFSLLKDLITKVVRGSSLMPTEKKSELANSTRLVSKTLKYPDTAAPGLELPKFTDEDVARTLYNVISLETMSSLMYETQESDGDITTGSEIKTQAKIEKKQGFNQSFSEVIKKLGGILGDQKSFKKCMDNRTNVIKNKYRDQQGQGSRGTKKARKQRSEDTTKKYIPLDPVKIVLELLQVEFNESEGDVDIALFYPKTMRHIFNNTTNTFPDANVNNNNNSSSSMSMASGELVTVPNDTNQKIMLFGGIPNTIRNDCDNIFETNPRLAALFHINPDEEATDNRTEDIDRVLAILKAIQLSALGHLGPTVQFTEIQYSTLYKDILNDVQAVAIHYFKRVIPRGLFYRSLHNCLYILRIIARARATLSLSDIPKNQLFTPSPVGNQAQLNSIGSKLEDQIYSAFDEGLLKVLEKPILTGGYEINVKTINGKQLSKEEKKKAKDENFSYSVLGFYGGGFNFLSLRSGFVPVSEYMKIISKVNPTINVNMYRDLGNTTNLLDAVESIVKNLISNKKDLLVANSRTMILADNSVVVALKELRDTFIYMSTRCEESTTEMIMRCVQLAQYGCNFGLTYSDTFKGYFEMDTNALKNENTNILKIGEGMIENIFKLLNKGRNLTEENLDNITLGGGLSTKNTSILTSMTSKGKELIKGGFPNGGKEELPRCIDALEILYRCAAKNMKIRIQSLTLYQRLTVLILNGLPNTYNSIALPPVFNITIDQMRKFFELIETEEATDDEDT